MDLRSTQDLTSNPLTGFPSPTLQAAIDTVLSADGLIAVTPIYSGSYSGLFKTFFDVLERDALAGMPVLLAATAGSTRHSLAIDHAMRPLFAYLGAAVVPTGVFAAAEDWGTAEAPLEPSLAVGGRVHHEAVLAQGAAHEGLGLEVVFDVEHVHEPRG
jgi:FMN reductase